MAFGKKKAKPKVAAKKVVKKAVKGVTKVKPKSGAKTTAKVDAKKKTTTRKAATPKIPVINKIQDKKAFELLSSFRISTPKQVFCKRESDVENNHRRIGFPCVMKISGDTIIHKSELNGIVKDINDLEQAKTEFTRLMKIKGVDSILMQEQISGVELIIGSKSNDDFGSVVSVGMGGIYTEILRDVAFRIPPVGTSEAEKMVNELKGVDILKGARGQEPIKLTSIYDILAKVGRLAASKKISEMDINPLICNERGCWAVDVRIIK